MPASYSNYLYQNNSGTMTPYVNVYVQLTSDTTGTSHVSIAQTDSNGMFVITNIPGDTYTAYVSNSPVGPWISTGNVSFDVGYVAGDSAILQSVTTLVKPWFDVTHPTYGAKGDGIADDTVAIQAAIVAAGNVTYSGNGGVSIGATVFFPPGVFRITAPLLVSQHGVTLKGAGKHATVILIDATFVGAAAIHFTSGSEQTICDLTIGPPNSNYALNPACDAILTDGGNYFTTYRDLNFWFVNGWCINIIPGSGQTAFPSFLTNITSQACKQGFHVKAAIDRSYSAGFFAVNCLADSIQNGDAFFIDDASDSTLTNCQGSVSAGGSFVHVKGLSVACYMTACDGGGAAGAGSNAAILIDNNGANSPRMIKATGCTFGGGTGVSIVSGTYIGFTGVDFQNCATHGVSISGGGQIEFVGCNWNGNNVTNAANTYDLNVTTNTAVILVSECTFDSPNVTQAVNTVFPTNAVRLHDCYFNHTAGLNQPFLRAGTPGNDGYLYAEGDSADINLVLRPKGNGVVRLSAQATAWVNAVGGADGTTGSPQIATQGITDCDLRLIPSGKGRVQLPMIFGVGTVPTVGSGGSGVTALSVIAGGNNSEMQIQATLTAISPGVVIGVVAFAAAAVSAPKAVVCSLSAPTAGVAAPPIVGADTYTVNGFTLRSYGPTTVTTGTYIITCHVFF